LTAAGSSSTGTPTSPLQIRARLPPDSRPASTAQSRPATRADTHPPRDEIALPAARGLANRDIAARLCLSVRTVEVHIDHILTKLGFRAGGTGTPPGSATAKRQSAP